jgi:hypothetical protein
LLGVFEVFRIEIDDMETVGRVGVASGKEIGCGGLR